MSSDSSFQVLSADEAERRFSISSDVDYPFRDFATQQAQRLYAGGLRVAGSFNSEPKVDWNPYNVIVDGDLHVDGALDFADFGGGCYLLVTGNLYAKAIRLHGCPTLVVRGNVVVEGGILGHYGDDGGTLIVGGSTTAALVVSHLYFPMRFGTAPAALVLSNTRDVNCSVDFEIEEAGAVLRPELLDKDGSIDDRKLGAAIVNGAALLRANAIPTWKAALARLERLDPETTREIDLSEQKLRSFPEALFRFRNLQKLSLAGNALGSLPARIGELETLVDLDLSNMSLEGLPAEIGRLRALQRLVLDSNGFDSLPDALGELSELRTLSLARTTGPLPDSLGKLVRLEHLSLANRKGEDDPAPLPELVFELRALRSLDLRRLRLSELSDRLLELGALEELLLAGSLGELSAVPALHRLPKLRVLDFAGSSGFRSAYPPHRFLEVVWRIETLERLGIDRWGAQKGVRDALGQLPAEAFARMPKLRELDLSFNELTSLPESLFALRELSNVDLRYTQLDLATLDRLAAEYPSGVRFDLRNVARAQVEVDAPSWKLVHALVKEAADAEALDEKAARFEQALTACRPGTPFSEYDQLYAHYGAIDAIARQALVADPASKPQLVERLTSLSRAALALVPGAIWHFTDQGAFQEEVLRKASNALAWYQMEAASTPAALEEALASIQRGLAVARPEDDYLRDTQVRILLKLGRSEEAYRIVDLVLRAEPDSADFRDLVEDSGYQAWRANQAG